MQKREDFHALSRLRRELMRHTAELELTVKETLGRGPVVKGSVYEMARKCGKPSCACARGELHRSMTLSWSDKGKTRLLMIPSERLKELREKSEEYQRIRSSRARVSVLCKEILAMMDQVEKLRLEEPRCGRS